MTMGKELTVQGVMLFLSTPVSTFVDMAGPLAVAGVVVVVLLSRV